MAKEQIAVAELVLNMILGKTGGTRAVSYTHLTLPTT